MHPTSSVLYKLEAKPLLSKDGAGNPTKEEYFRKNSTAMKGSMHSRHMVGPWPIFIKLSMTCMESIEVFNEPLGIL